MLDCMTVLREFVLECSVKPSLDYNTIACVRKGYTA